MTLNPEVIFEKLYILRPEFLEKYGVVRIGLFGSYIRGEASPHSDIDIIVTFQENRETFDNYMDLKFFLEDMLEKSVDLVIEDTIKSRIKDRILHEAVYV
ncbi:nucleotidyltransferase family protein [uncultured Methanospirillum sp.]|uniref:nucleotidyltransferase family protein n=1 Tax=uncultured Methanospirillum sp. TaxID=262503 RepID=UPI0029C7DD95|nr:nucleotidyltransferase family protein [uncultured Methanospirillum sp.]